MTTTDPFYSDGNMRELEHRARDMDARKNVAEHELLEAPAPQTPTPNLGERRCAEESSAFGG